MGRSPQLFDSRHIQLRRANRAYYRRNRKTIISKNNRNRDIWRKRKRQELLESIAKEPTDQELDERALRMGL